MPDVRLIDANAVSKTLRNLPFGYAKSFAGQAALKEIENAPTIDATPVVHGRWEVVQVWKDNPQTTLRCSLCKTWQPIYEHDEWKFCPFCGMPMDAQDMDAHTKDGGAADGSDA